MIALAEDAARVQNEIEALCERIERMSRKRAEPLSARRDLYYFVGEVDFFQQDNVAQDMIFVVPQSDTFVAKRIGFYPFFRLITNDDATDGPDEVSFRPCILTTYEGSWNPYVDYDAAAIDFRVTIQDTNGESGFSRAWQNRPIPASAFYAGATNYREGGPNPLGANQFAGATYFSSFQFPGGLWLPDMEYPGGSTITARITPNFAGMREDPASPGASEARRNQYRVVGVIEGYKRGRP